MTPRFLCAALCLAASAPALLAQDTGKPEMRLEPTLAPAETPQPTATPIPEKSLVAYALLPASVEGGIIRGAMVGRMVDAVDAMGPGKVVFEGVPFALPVKGWSAP